MSPSIKKFSNFTSFTALLGLSVDFLKLMIDKSSNVKSLKKFLELHFPKSQHSELQLRKKQYSTIVLTMKQSLGKPGKYLNGKHQSDLFSLNFLFQLVTLSVQSILCKELLIYQLKSIKKERKMALKILFLLVVLVLLRHQ